MIDNKSAAFVASLTLLFHPVEAAMAPVPVSATLAPEPAPAVTSRATAPVPAVATVSSPPCLDPKSSIATERSVRFDFDEDPIGTDFNSLLERQGGFLASGQKRAEAVLRALELYGVKDAQMEVVSRGKTKPGSLGHDETAWAQDRGADLQYPSK